MVKKINLQGLNDYSSKLRLFLKKIEERKNKTKFSSFFSIHLKRKICFSPHHPIGFQVPTCKSTFTNMFKKLNNVKYLK